MPFFINFLLVFGSFLAVWLWQLKSKNAGVVDALWAIIIPFQALVYLVHSQQFNLRNGIIWALIAFWGFRLGIYLFVRNHGKAEDARYAQIRIDNPQNADLKILKFYIFQAIFSFLLFLPGYWVFNSSGASFSYTDYLGVVFLALGGIGEAVADEQLRRFKANPANKGQIFDKGLWKYTRHPNYFCEWLAWVGIAVLCLSVPFGSLAIASPLVMFYLLTKGTGVSLTEETIMKTKGEKYQKYIASTPAFFPKLF